MVYTALNGELHDIIRKANNLGTPKLKFFVVLDCHKMGKINLSKPLFTDPRWMLINLNNNKIKKFWECSESNFGRIANAPLCYV